MPDLSVSRLENRVSVVGDVRTPADRELLREHIVAALADAVDVDSNGPCDEIVLDVAQASYLDTAALTSLILVARRCVDVGARLTLEGASDELREQLRETRIDQVLGMHGVQVVASDNSDGTGAAA